MGQVNLGYLVAARVVDALCMYHYRSGAKPDDWADAERWAAREFRAASKQTIRALVSRARAARQLATEYNRGGKRFKPKLARKG